MNRYVRIFKALVADPVAVGRTVPGEIRQRRGRARYANTDVDAAWYERLHSMLGVAWPCREAAHLTAPLAEIEARLALHGIRPGRSTYGYYSDADSGLCSAIWCIIKHIKPRVVIETGVAHGVSSQVVLEALAQNKHGRLWSIDLRHPFHPELYSQTGVAVAAERLPGWEYIEGPSRQRLPAVIAEVGHVDVFIHDSLHTARNTLFEMNQVAPVMAVGGVMLIDDIFQHDGFTKFTSRHPEYRTMICQPSDQLGAFGIAIKSGPSVAGR